MNELLNLTPLQQVRAPRLARRLTQLMVGLVLYGVSLALMVEAHLGLDPWDVLHFGVARWLPLSFGSVVIVAGALVLLLWIPLRQMPGVGTVANVLVIGVVTDLALAVLDRPDPLLARVALVVAGVVLNAFASALYIGAQLGPGPRDGLMTGLVRRTGWSVRLVRTTIELSVLSVGFALGGTVGLGTALYAVAIGPLLHRLLPVFVVPMTPAAPGPDPYREWIATYRVRRPGAVARRW